MPNTRESNFKPLPDWERDVCRRLAERRREKGGSQEEFAAAIGLTRSQLANIEAGRVPLRFWPGWRACEKLHINQRWLESGTLPSRPFFKLDLSKVQKRITERSLFSQICGGFLAADLELRSDIAWSIGQYQADGTALFKSYAEELVEIVKVFLERIPIVAEREAAFAALKRKSFAELMRQHSVKSDMARERKTV